MKNKVAIVTGGNSGIGRAIAEALAGVGMKIVVAGRRKEANELVVQELVKRHGVEAMAKQVDVSDEKECIALVRDTVKEFGQLDLLINNAGVLTAGELSEIETEEIERVFKTNVYGSVWCAREAAKAMEANKVSSANEVRGSIINIASVAGKEGFGGLGTYCASKHALMGFSKAFGEECAEKMIKMSDICPGYVATPMVENAPVDQMKMIQPSDIAKTVIYLLGLSSYCWPREVVIGRIESTP